MFIPDRLTDTRTKRHTYRHTDIIFIIAIAIIIIAIIVIAIIIIA